MHHDLGGDGPPIKIDAGSPCMQVPTWVVDHTDVFGSDPQAPPWDFTVVGDAYQTLVQFSDMLSTEHAECALHRDDRHDDVV
jgi:hypothetical protein